MLIEFIVAESDTTWHTEIHDVPNLYQVAQQPGELEYEAEQWALENLDKFHHDPAAEIVGIWVYNSNPETEQETVDRLLVEKQAQKK